MKASICQKACRYGLFETILHGLKYPKTCRDAPPGDGFPVCELDTAAGKVSIGAMICYDREFPESARILMLNGAEVILVPNACDMNDIRLRQLSVRAFENMVGVAMANYAGPGWGKSAAYHPCVFTEDGQAVDPTIVEADASEGMWMTEFDMNSLRKYRERETQSASYASYVVHPSSRTT